MKTEKRIYTKKDMCEILEVSIQTINNFIGKGLIKPIYIGGSVRFSQDEVDRLLSKGTGDKNEK